MEYYAQSRNWTLVGMQTRPIPGNASPQADEAKEPKWDKFYAAPNDEVVLVSSDKIHFRASGYRLMKASGLFAGMMDTIHPHSPNAGEPIPVAFDADTVRAFLDFVCASKPECLRATLFGIPTVANLLRMVKEYDCAALIPEVRKQFQVEACQDAPVALLWASEIDDVEAARHAIQCIDGQKQGITSRAAQLRAFLSQLRPEWRHHLLELLISDEPMRHGGRGCPDEPGFARVNRYWGSIADAFNPHGTTDIAAEVPNAALRSLFPEEEGRQYDYDSDEW